MATKRQPVTGKYARAAMEEVIGVAGAMQRDMVGVAVSLGVNDREAISEGMRELMGHTQRMIALARGALEADYDDLGLEIGDND